MRRWNKYPIVGNKQMEKIMLFIPLVLFVGFMLSNRNNALIGATIMLALLIFWR